MSALAPGRSILRPVTSHFRIPSFRALARHALPHLVEATLIPLGLFYLCLWLSGTTGAILAALTWAYAAIARRWVTGRRLPGLLLLGAAGLTARTAVALASGSTFVYFLQPSLTTIAIAGVFLVSVRAGRPLAERLAADFVVIPPELLRTPVIRRVFVRITVLWAIVNLFNAVATIGLLLSQSMPVYVAARTALSLVGLAFGVVTSTLLFKRALATASA
jgi:hypothetical protein